jgi:hypothetical protein
MRSSAHAAGACAHSGVARAKYGVPRLEVADVFRQFGDEYARTHPLLPSQTRALRDIVDCRTAALGGRLEKCDHCGHETPVYCSCCNRHCPKCQMLAKAKWLEARGAELLPVLYYHAVFTLPHLLNPLLYDNQRLLYGLLFECVSETLREFAAEPKHLGGKLGFTAILHTWDQQLNYHAHLHCLIPAGALSSDGKEWIRARSNYLFPAKALSAVFRGKFRAGLQALFEAGQLRWNDRVEQKNRVREFKRLLARLYKTEWVVYLKPSFGGPEQTLDYLGRYTHRVAISNSRLIKLENGRVHFTYRDRRDGDRLKECELPTPEFIRRFLQHALPKSFVRVRHFGFLANGCKQACLAQCRTALHAAPPPQPQKQTVQEWLRKLTGAEVTLCRHCHTGHMVFVRDLPPNFTRHLPARPEPGRPAAPLPHKSGDTS